MMVEALFRSFSSFALLFVFVGFVFVLAVSILGGDRLSHVLTGRSRSLVLLLGILLCLCSKPGHAQCPTATQTIGSVTWTPNWCDEFNGPANSAIDPTKWTYDTGSSGFGNNELETYCAPSSNTAPCSATSPNAFIDGNGHLGIQVLGPANSDCNPVGTCTSARLKTAGLEGFNSGRIEASIQIPSHAGLWPAFWNLGSQPGVSWPTVGESDIMENWPTTSKIPGPGATGNRSTIHTMITAGSGLGQGFTFPSGQAVNTNFHAYGQIWSANMIQYYVDDPTHPFFVVTASDLPAGDTWPFSSSANPFFIILNVAVGGTLGTPTDTATSSQPPMLVDYVRQYLPSSVTTILTQPSAISLTAGATTANTTTLNISQPLGSGRVTFSCSTNAPKASCLVTSADPTNKYTIDFSSASSGSGTVTVTTATNAPAAGVSFMSWTGMASQLGFVVLLMLLRMQTTQIRLRAFLASTILTIGLLPACGGGNSAAGNGGGGGANGTTPGSYTVTVNAYNISSSDAATPSATTTFNLTVN
jgi:beta-glucanase (GH16 family)